MHFDLKFFSEHLHSPARSSKNSSPIEPHICPRYETVDILANTLKRYAVVHVRGTPATGKSRLAQLLQAHFEQDYRVVFIEGWTGGRRPAAILVGECHEEGYKDVSAKNLMSSRNYDLLFIIDEAHATYADSRLWYTLIKDRIGVSYGPLFCLFSSYGSPSTGSPNYPFAVTPPVLYPSKNFLWFYPRTQQRPNLPIL